MDILPIFTFKTVGIDRDDKHLLPPQALLKNLNFLYKLKKITLDLDNKLHI